MVLKLSESQIFKLSDPNFIKIYLDLSCSPSSSTMCFFHESG